MSGMCGRFVQAKKVARYERMFGVSPSKAGSIPMYNVTPSMYPKVCMISDWGSRELWQLRWGLVPHWADSPKFSYSTINARAETVAEKPAYRVPFRRRRCLIPVDGFYEWKDVRPRKQPHYIRMKDGEPFALAGIWDRWEKPGEQSLPSFAIIVGKPNDLVAQVHDRMPVILPPDLYDIWLDPAVTDPQQLLPLLQLFPAHPMELYAVSLEVNNPKNNTPDLIKPIPRL